MWLRTEAPSLPAARRLIYYAQRWPWQTAWPLARTKCDKCFHSVNRLDIYLSTPFPKSLDSDVRQGGRTPISTADLTANRTMQLVHDEDSHGWVTAHGWSAKQKTCWASSRISSCPALVVNMQFRCYLRHHLIAGEGSGDIEHGWAGATLGNTRDTTE